MTILDSISQRHYFASKYPYRQSYGFSSSQVWIWELDHKAECQRIDAFELWCWKRLSRVLWTARRSDHYILRKSVLNIHWKDWCWSWNSNALATWCEELTHWKRPWSWEWLKAGREGDDRGWDGWMASVNGHEFEQAPGVGDGQGILECCSPWVSKESDTTEWLNWTEWPSMASKCPNWDLTWLQTWLLI